MKKEKFVFEKYGDETYVAVSKLKLATYYQKRLIEGDTRDLFREVILANGVKSPLIVNTYPGREGVIIDGAERYRLAMEFGIHDLPAFPIYVAENEEKKLHYEFSIKVREYNINDIIEALRKPYENYFTGIVTRESQIDDAIFRNAALMQKNAKENPKARQQAFSLRMGEFYGYLEKAKLLTGADSINEALVNIVINFVDTHSL